MQFEKCFKHADEKVIRLVQYAFYQQHQRVKGRRNGKRLLG